MEAFPSFCVFILLWIVEPIFIETCSDNNKSETKKYERLEDDEYL